MGFYFGATLLVAVAYFKNSRNNVPFLEPNLNSNIADHYFSN